MTVIWSRRAARELYAVYEYIATDNETAATRVVDRIRQAINLLANQPELGRASRLVGRREFISSYVVTYRVKRDLVLILELEHGAQRR
jgi:toxin ParE1/3/4